MSYADSDAVRRELSEAYMQRAYPANDVKLKELFFLRQQLAELLGRPNYATLVLEDKMVDSPEKVQSLITEMADAARPAATRDYAKYLTVLKEIDPSADKVEYWQTAWLLGKVKQKYYDYDPQEARQYFAYNDVRDGILKLTERPVRRRNPPLGHPDVGPAGRDLRDGRPRQGHRPVLLRFTPAPGQVHPRQHDPAFTRRRGSCPANRRAGDEPADRRSFDRADGAS